MHFCQQRLELAFCGPKSRRRFQAAALRAPLVERGVRTPALAADLPASTEPVDALLVDDHALMRHGIALLLQQGSMRFRVVGEAGDLGEALRRLAQAACRPTLAIAETTVKIHVQHILRKLGLTSRVQAAAVVAAAGSG